ncbi:MAG: conjugal transfer protein TraI [Chitinophagaceae bacterium]
MNPYLKKIAVIAVTVVCFLLPVKSYSQTVILDIIKAATTKVIRAIDLRIQRLQNKTIDLQNIQKEIENKLSKLKLDEIAEWTKKQKEIYQQYFDELWQVKSVIAYYKRVTEIIQQQKNLVSEYKRAWTRLQQDKNFSRKELDFIYSIYSGILDASVKNLDQVLLVVESWTLQMSDADRLEILNSASDEIEENLADLRAFTNQNIQISLRRTRDVQELQALKKLYGLPL